MTWTLLGAVAGGIVFGILSDYLGRVRVLTWTILLFAIFTGLCALAQGYWDLLVYRTIAGLGLGGEFGIGMALVAEAWPAPHARARLLLCRARLAGRRAGGGARDAAAAAADRLARHVRGRPGAGARRLRRPPHVGEPEIFIEARAAPRARMPLGLLVKDAATAKISLGMFILCSVQNFGYYGLMIWLPSYLSGRFGFTPDPIRRVDRGDHARHGVRHIGLRRASPTSVGRRPMFLTFQAGAFVMVVVYSQLTTPTALLIGGAVMGVFVNGMLGGYGALISELYPTEARATAQNVLFNLGRGVGGFGPLVIGALAVSYSFSTAIALLALIYVLDIAATLTLIPERKGQPLG